VKYPPNNSWRYLAHYTDYITQAPSGNRPLQQFKKISIVEVKGYCYGWHFYPAADADLVVASDDALFGHAAFRYAGWGPRMWTWIEMIGLRQFEEMVFTGRPFTAQEMRESKFINSLVPRERLEAEVQKYALACARNSPTDRIVIQKAFFEIYKQNRGEYMGALLTSLMESLGPQVRPGPGEFVLNQDVLDSGLPAAVREAEKRFPPDWRMSKSGRRAE
jgi:enoyl-CoA hydratase/carnithine racemase